MTGIGRMFAAVAFGILAFVAGDRTPLAAVGRFEMEVQQIGPTGAIPGRAPCEPLGSALVGTTPRITADNPVGDSIGLCIYDNPMVTRRAAEVGPYAGGVSPEAFGGANGPAAMVNVTGDTTTTPRVLPYTLSAVARAGGVSDDAVRSALRGAPLQTTSSGGASLPKVQRYVDRLRAGEVPLPIKVDGTRIVDGNHRYIASRIAGVDIEVQPWAGSRRPVVDWADLPIDPTDWGRLMVRIACADGRVTTSCTSPVHGAAS